MTPASSLFFRFHSKDYIAYRPRSVVSQKSKRSLLDATIRLRWCLAYEAYSKIHFVSLLKCRATLSSRIAAFVQTRYRRATFVRAISLRSYDCRRCSSPDKQRTTNVRNDIARINSRSCPFRLIATSLATDNVDNTRHDENAQRRKRFVAVSWTAAHIQIQRQNTRVICHPVSGQDMRVEGECCIQTLSVIV